MVSNAVRLCALLIAITAVIAAGGADREVVKFRLKDWKSVHFDDGKSAATYLEIMKQLGCEAQQEKHGGHIDVRYRCKDWRSLALKTHADAHKWEKWLKSNGFETRHEH